MIKEAHSGDNEGSDRNHVSGVKGSHLTLLLTEKNIWSQQPGIAIICQDVR